MKENNFAISSAKQGGDATIDPFELILLTILRVFRTLRLERMLRFLTGTHSFTDYFKGFEKVEAVRQLFGEKTEQVLRNLKVHLIPIWGYMWVSNMDGHIIVSSRYLNSGSKVDIYLDVIHELTHVKQFLDGKELFDVNYGYTERPTEVEAYRRAVVEAKRLGLSNEKICEYLKTEWMSEEDLKRLAKTLNIECGRSKDQVSPTHP